MNIVNTRGRAAIWGAVTLVTAALAPVQPAVANNLTNISSVDAIDFTFAAGGGMFTGGILNATDDAWLVFSASLGDNISINFSSNSFGYVGVVYQDTGDGVVQIGDGMNVSNFNINNVGLGSPLTILNPSIGSNALCCYQFASGASSNTFNFVAPTTGDYGMVLAGGNDAFKSFNFTVTLSGNTSQVPEPTTMMLLGLGLDGLGFMRRLH